MKMAGINKKKRERWKEKKNEEKKNREKKKKEKEAIEKNIGRREEMDYNYNNCKGSGTLLLKSSLGKLLGTQ